MFTHVFGPEAEVVDYFLSDDVLHVIIVVLVFIVYEADLGHLVLTVGGRKDGGEYTLVDIGGGNDRELGCVAH